ncbi:hypothetical protein BDY24DRAFT_415587, partial [Mrakia frigida]|uniref:uncharacterized protein n=1 Tax=Mrakia frigida TaxID=29902 RepID=UPI003FCC096A
MVKHDPTKEPERYIFMGDDNVDVYTHGQMYEPTPMPKHVPHVAELGITSAPLKSASFLMGTY